jgi:CTP synthase (UTP-ammonia lyase)
VGDAVHAEYGLAGTEVIAPLACSLVDHKITVALTPSSLLARLHRTTTVVEQTTCNYGLSPSLQHVAAEHGMSIAATDDTGEVRAIERPDHPFFAATLYQPQLSSHPGRPHPLFLGFVAAAFGLDPALPRLVQG